VTGEFARCEGEQAGCLPQLLPLFCSDMLLRGLSGLSFARLALAQRIMGLDA